LLQVVAVVQAELLVVEVLAVCAQDLWLSRLVFQIQ
jgi:hypothetical protein